MTKATMQEFGPVGMLAVNYPGATIRARRNGPVVTLSVCGTKSARTLTVLADWNPTVLREHLHDSRWRWEHGEWRCLRTRSNRFDMRVNREVAKDHAWATEHLDLVQAAAGAL